MVIFKDGKIVKKTTQGRKKIAIQKIESLSSRQVTFSKRRVGLFKKASELCILSGAQVAIIVQSLAKRVFSFGYPSPESVVDRFLSGGDGGEDDNSAAASKARDYDRNYSDICKELEAEKKRKAMMEEEVKRADLSSAGGFWWDEAVEGLDLEELERHSAALEDLMKNVNMRADDLMLANSSASLPAPPMTDVGRCLLDDTTAALVNQSQGTGGCGLDYGSCNVNPYGNFGPRDHFLN